MNRLDLIKRVRSYTRDLSNSIFREEDIVAYINESVDRIKQVIVEMDGMLYLETQDASPILLPNHYHYLLATYATSRCFGQDERHYQATNYMNEFETKLDELRRDIEMGRVVIKDANGNVVTAPLNTDYVKEVYFASYDEDEDLGVEGV